MTTKHKASPHLKKGWAAILLVALACTYNTASSHAKPSQTTQTKTPYEQTIMYDVYASGFRAVGATLNIKATSENTYTIHLDTKTIGTLGKLAPWKGSFESSGIIANDQKFTPLKHESIATWRDETEVKTYNYNKNHELTSLTVKDHDKPLKTKTINPELTNDTTDILSATLTIMDQIAHGQTCTGASEIFDGKRRFKQSFKHARNGTLESTKYNVYKGEAQKCTVEVVPVAGKWHEKPRGWMSIQEQGRDKGTMPTVWMAQMSENTPAIPVRVMVKTKYGAFVMHLVEYKDKDVHLMSNKQKRDHQKEQNK